MSEIYGTFSTAYVEAMRLRLSALESENKGLSARVEELESENKAMRKRAELVDGDVKNAQAILDASNTYIRRIEVELQSESQAKIDAEFHVAALKERLAKLEAENKDLRDRFSDADTERNAAQAALKATFARVAELEARCKRMEESARAVYLDSIASDHPWSELETRNMHALRDVLETKP